MVDAVGGGVSMANRPQRFWGVETGTRTTFVRLRDGGIFVHCPAGLDAGSADAFRTAVAYVGGMTDRYACRQALALLGWQRDRLPVGIDV